MKILIWAKILRSLIFIVLSFLCLKPAIGQNQEFYNKLKQADSLLNLAKMPEAIQILSLLDQQGSPNEDLYRLLGKAYYWSGDFEKTKDFFRKRINENPDYLQLQLDFARIFYELQEFSQSKKFLEKLIIQLPEDLEVNQKLAEINYWTGGKKKTSLNYLDNILVQYPENKAALDLKEEINLVTAPLLFIRSGIYSDSQPMLYGFLGAEISLYQSSILQPSLLVESRFYENNETLTQLQVKNKFGFVSTKTNMTLGFGLVQNQNWNSTLTTFISELQQKLGNGFFTRFSFAKEAYLYTLASLQQPISPQLLSLSLSRESSNSWIGNLQLDQRTFESSNTLRSFNLWMLVPVIKTQKFLFHIGYSGSLANTDSVRFAPESTFSPTTTSPKVGDLIPGSYNPYFTPINQSIHSILAKGSLKFSPNQSLDITANYGIFAEIENPNIYYFGPNNTNPTPIEKDDLLLIFNTESYHPIDLKIEYKNILSKRTELQLIYQYQKTIFFNSNTLHLSLMKKF